MADYDPKDVPILDDVIEHADNKKTDTETIESALIDYNAVDEAETSTIDMPVIDNQTDNPLVEAKQQTSTAISLQSVTDDIVEQMMPKLELQLRFLLKQALKEKLPEEITRVKVPPSSNTDS